MTKTPADDGRWRWAEAFVVVYVVGAVMYGFTSRSGNPPWLLALSAAAGVAAAFVNHRYVQLGVSADSRWLVVFLLSFFTGSQLFLSFFASISFAHGALSFARGKIEVGGKAGPRRTWVGTAARLRSLAWIVSGGALAAWAVLRN